MPKTFFIAPTALNSGLTSICLGLVRALDNVGIRVSFFKPVAQSHSSEKIAVESIDKSVQFVRAKTNLLPPQPISLKYAQTLVSQNKTGRLMEEIIALYQQTTVDADVVIVEGLVPDRSEPYTARLNAEIARNLDAEVLLVASPKNMTPAELDEHLELSARLYAAPEDPDVIGCILNKVNAPETSDRSTSYNYDREQGLGRQGGTDYVNQYEAQCKIFNEDSFKLVGSIPWRYDLLAPRTSDIAKQLDAIFINKGDIENRRVSFISVCARTIPNMVDQLSPGTLVVTPGDREDIIIATCMAALNGVPLAGLVLTGNLQPDPRTLKLCNRALEAGLPMLSARSDTFEAANRLSEMSGEVPVDDLDRIERVMEAVANALEIDWLRSRLNLAREPRLSPPAFRYQLSERARSANKRIVLPEGNEPRTIQAAVICHQRGLAQCILIGKEAEIHTVAEAQGVIIPPDITIIDPDEVRENYVQPMVQLRKHKGLAPDMAQAQLEDNVVLATMMVALDEVDGLVSGAVHTTANTIRPALQLIKTHPEARVVSSVFFMCLPEQVLVYGDCAVNPDPNAQQLADIAIQSANSAKTFGVTPRVAMISYSTGSSGSGDDVDKVREATRIAKEQRPDLIIDGPLQYDAAAIESVARSKAPNSPVAGKATVFVFPDLNTGNTTYKAVQRSANVISIGPMLQGLNKPVNDLSRGALVEDIVFTIALTAVQATQTKN
ncbi:phosphate acetyltransferase [Alkalimarinus coralli]|uniref:phosphate acetyltransferase n=1 Tax=Alkalimarinus coralli TaxID=2935863 RepID=UPI00202B2373|nr:phosphate acetyltransferase [Alkalimarinus coralli]